MQRIAPFVLVAASLSAARAWAASRSSSDLPHVQQSTAGARSHRRRRQRRTGRRSGRPALGPHARARRERRRRHRDRPDARVRHRVEHLGQATGFVVDAERGLILTNRHVVTPGPVTSEATFLNREEVQLYPVYRDPVHDFGIYRYDPTKLRFIKPRRCRCTRTARRSAARSASSATTPASSCRSSPARSPSSTATRPNTASASTTTSTPSTSRPPRAPRAAPPARRSSTSRAAWSR